MEPEHPDADDGQGTPAQGQAGSDVEHDPGVAALRARGAHRLDPVRFAFLEALARRTRRQSGMLRQLLEQRLEQGVAAFGARHDAAIADLDKMLPDAIREYPQAASALRRLPADGDPGGVQGRLALLGREPADGALAELVRLVDGQAATDGKSNGDGPAGTKASGRAAPTGATPLRELRTAQRFRSTWTRLRIDDQLSRSQRQAPENPGPLNSHLLVLRALHHLREIAPAYLEGLMAHVEALTWLDKAELPRPATSGATANRERRKRKGSAAPR